MIGDGTLYHACAQANSKSYISSFPYESKTLASFTRKFDGYWLMASNGKGVNDGFCTIQVKFNKQNAAFFIEACNTIFKKHMQIK